MLTTVFLGGPWHGDRRVIPHVLSTFHIPCLAEPLNWDAPAYPQASHAVRVTTTAYRLEKVRLFGRSFRVYVHESVPPASPEMDALAFEAFVSAETRGLILAQETEGNR